MNEFLRLLRTAAPYRGRLLAALAAMLLYAAGSLGIVTQVKPIFDEVLPARESVAQVALILLGAYFVKGIGAYASGYLMTWVGQRVVTDLRGR